MCVTVSPAVIRRSALPWKICPKIQVRIRPDVATGKMAYRRSSWTLCSRTVKRFENRPNARWFGTLRSRSKKIEPVADGVDDRLVGPERHPEPRAHRREEPGVAIRVAHEAPAALHEARVPAARVGRLVDVADGAEPVGFVLAAQLRLAVADAPVPPVADEQLGVVVALDERRRVREVEHVPERLLGVREVDHDVVRLEQAHHLEPDRQLKLRARRRAAVGLQREIVVLVQEHVLRRRIAGDRFGDRRALGRGNRTDHLLRRRRTGGALTGCAIGDGMTSGVADVFARARGPRTPAPPAPPPTFTRRAASRRYRL